MESTLHIETPKTYQYDKDLIWAFPRICDRNISATVDGVVLGDNDLIGDLNEKHCDDKESNEKTEANYYPIDIPKISVTTFFDIAEKLVNKEDHNYHNNNNNCDINERRYRHLRFTKKNEITRACLKKIARISATICPRCHFSTCWQCCNIKVKKKGQSNTNTHSTSIISCFNCNNIFKAYFIDENFLTKKKSFHPIRGFQSKKCMALYSQIFHEFLDYLKLKRRATFEKRKGIEYHHRNKLLILYNSLTQESKRELNYLPDKLNYSLRVGENVIVPPMIFFLNMNKSMSFFKKMLSIESTMSVKTRYGSVFSRASGGKTNIFRVICCNRRHVISARIVIVPRYQLKPHECILPFSTFCRLGCPKFVLCHRYPTLDLKSMTFHEVKGTWQFPSMAISTSIVCGNNADFDGDCLHVIPAMTLPSQAELYYLLHPRYNILTQQKLRVQFDHDERQTIYSLFGLNSSEIHDGLHEMAIKEGSEKAYDFFCKLKEICNFVWQNKTINTISCRDFLSLIPQKRKISYIKYISEYYPKIVDHNGIKEIVESNASRFGIDHTWQLFGEISKDAPVGFLQGMNKKQFIKVAKNARNNLVSEISMYGYTIIKLTHCTKSITIGYDGRIYTTDGVLVALDIEDII